MHVTYSTEINIKTVVKFWYDINVTVYRLFFQVFVNDCAARTLVN